MKLKHVHSSVSWLHMLSAGYGYREYIKTGIVFVWATVGMYSY